MPQIFLDNFDNETIGQPPSDWEVSDPTKVTVETDPAPDYQNDLAMRMATAESTYETVVANRAFDPQEEVVELKFKFCVTQATTPAGLADVYTFSEMIVFKPQEPLPGRILSMALTKTGAGAQQIVLYPESDKKVVLGSWTESTWHEIRLKFTFAGIFNWVEIFIDDQTVPYSFGENYNPVSQLGFTAISRTIGAQPCTCTVYVDDVECSQEGYEMSGEYFCPATRFSIVFPIAPVDIQAVFSDGGIPLIPNNYKEGFEPSNVDHPHLGREWRSALVNPRETSGSTIAEHLLSFDLGSAQEVQAVGILNHNLADFAFLADEPGRDILLIATDDRGKPVNEWDYYFNLNLVAVMGWYLRLICGESNVLLGLTNILIFPQQTYRYWGILIRQYAPIDDEGERQTTSLEYFKIGRVVLGTIGETTYNFSDEWEVEVVDPSKTVENTANARWARAINPYRKIRLKFDLNDADGEQVADYLGAFHKEPHIFVIIPERVNQEIDKTSYVYARISEDSFNLNYIFRDYAGFEVELAEEVW